VKRRHRPELSLALIMSGMVVLIVVISIFLAFEIFMGLYENSMKESAITSSEQAIGQVAKTIAKYTDNISLIMEEIQNGISNGEEDFANLLDTRPDIVAITMYDESGRLTGCWAGEYELKKSVAKNLSYMEIPQGSRDLNISKPHIESLFVGEYPWVVTIAQDAMINSGEWVRISLDIRFSEIANYMDGVGIGQHGYCFIMDKEGNVIYHPKQQLLYFKVKEENTETLQLLADGSHTESNVIYTIRSLENCDWRIVGVCSVDEVITAKVRYTLRLLGALLLLVLLTASISGGVFARIFSNPVKILVKAMGKFEENAEEFQFTPVRGTSEVAALSDSFGHMVVNMQKLVERIRQEEVFLRKTELNALQSQINPHFLYNTLDSVSWMCEEGRNKDAAFMVNTLARLFRISISKGHDLIPIEKELQHAECYLQIQKFRYKNQFNYSIEADPECLSYYCNKIMLQPMIENAIYHGLDRMVDEGAILIRIFWEGKDIVMEVEDNGIGMTPQQCEDILQIERKERKVSGDQIGIGIKNVHDRIRIYFGEPYGIVIESEEDVGTKVIIRIPAIKEGEL
jgi:two-component system sensor histidine kinase YesM